MAGSLHGVRGWGWFRVLLAGTLGCGLLAGCSAFSDEPREELLIRPSIRRITVARADGRSWDGGHGPLHPLASNFSTQDPPPGVDPADRNLFMLPPAPPDPFVEIWQGERLRFVSDAEQDSFEPTWPLEPLLLEVAPSSEIRIAVWDRDDGPQDLIGETLFTGEELLAPNILYVEHDGGQLQGIKLFVTRKLAFP